MTDWALDDAAAAALWSIRHAPVEHIGALYGSEARPTGTVSAGSKESVRGELQVPGGTAAIRALFHNHPPTKRNISRDAFSDDDKSMARRLGVSSYIASGERLRRFDPQNNETSDVLAQIPLEEIRRLYIAEALSK